MEFLGIGPSELLFIIIIALIVLGPRDMQKAGRTIGKWLRRIVTSDGWKLFQQTSREIQTLPNRLMREAALEELQEMQKDLQKDMRQPFEIKGRPSESSQQATPQTALPTEPSTDLTSNTENRILPPPAPPAAPATPAGDEEAHG
jgi:sec-independent protein translocase protein TatB